MYPFLKRLFDLVAAAAALLALSPILGLIWCAIRIKMGSPAMFTQERAGFLGKPFHVFKFRTMSATLDASGHLLPDSDRLTPLGRILRKTSLDELPQLFNVIRSDMSLVGPRPLYMRYIPRYTQAQRRRLEAKPGITGLAQVNGRNALSWEDRFALDIQYVDSISFWLDLRILFKTAWRVVRPEGISQAGRATMDEFLGSAAEEQP